MTRRPLTGPFVVDYLLPDGRHFSFTLEGPRTLAEAEAHLRAIQRGAWIEGGEAETIRSNIVTLWIDGALAGLNAKAVQAAAWLKLKWKEAARALDR